MTPDPTYICVRFVEHNWHGSSSFGDRIKKKWVYIFNLVPSREWSEKRNKWDRYEYYADENGMYTPVDAYDASPYRYKKRIEKRLEWVWLPAVSPPNQYWVHCIFSSRVSLPKRRLDALGDELKGSGLGRLIWDNRNKSPHQPIKVGEAQVPPRFQVLSCGDIPGVIKRHKWEDTPPMVKFRPVNAKDRKYEVALRDHLAQAEELGLQLSGAIIDRAKEAQSDPRRVVVGSLAVALMGLGKDAASKHLAQDGGKFKFDAGFKHANQCEILAAQIRDVISGRAYRAVLDDAKSCYSTKEAIDNKKIATSFREAKQKTSGWFGLEVEDSFLTVEDSFGQTVKNLDMTKIGRKYLAKLDEAQAGWTTFFAPGRKASQGFLEVVLLLGKKTYLHEETREKYEWRNGRNMKRVLNIKEERLRHGWAHRLTKDKFFKSWNYVVETLNATQSGLNLAQNWDFWSGVGAAGAAADFYDLCTKLSPKLKPDVLAAKFFSGKWGKVVATHALRKVAIVGAIADIIIEMKELAKGLRRGDWVGIVSHGLSLVGALIGGGAFLSSSGVGAIVGIAFVVAGLLVSVIWGESEVERFLERCIFGNSEGSSVICVAIKGLDEVDGGLLEEYLVPVGSDYYLEDAGVHRGPVDVLMWGKVRLTGLVSVVHRSIHELYTMTLLTAKSQYDALSGKEKEEYRKTIVRMAQRPRKVTVNGEECYVFGVDVANDFLQKLKPKK